MSTSIKVSGRVFPIVKESTKESNDKTWTFTTRPGGWILAESADGERRRFVIREDKNRFSASLGGYLWKGEWVQKHRDVGGASSESDLVAQFPGKVRKVLVQAGAHVSEGDVLLQLEAMKMEFSVRAPYSGVIKKIGVAEGQQLTPGDQLVELEGQPGGDGPE